MEKQSRLRIDDQYAPFLHPGSWPTERYELLVDLPNNEDFNRDNGNGGAAPTMVALAVVTSLGVVAEFAHRRTTRKPQQLLLIFLLLRMQCLRGSHVKLKTPAGVARHISAQREARA